MLFCFSLEVSVWVVRNSTAPLTNLSFYWLLLVGFHPITILRQPSSLALSRKQVTGLNNFQKNPRPVFSFEFNSLCVVTKQVNASFRILCIFSARSFLIRGNLEYEPDNFRQLVSESVLTLLFTSHALSSGTKARVAKISRPTKKLSYKPTAS